MVPLVVGTRFGETQRWRSAGGYRRSVIRSAVLDRDDSAGVSWREGAPPARRVRWQRGNHPVAGEVCVGPDLVAFLEIRVVSPRDLGDAIGLCPRKDRRLRGHGRAVRR